MSKFEKYLEAVKKGKGKGPKCPKCGATRAQMKMGKDFYLCDICGWEYSPEPTNESFDINRVSAEQSSMQKQILSQFEADLEQGKEPNFSDAVQTLLKYYKNPEDAEDAADRLLAQAQKKVGKK